MQFGSTPWRGSNNNDKVLFKNIMTIIECKNMKSDGPIFTGLINSFDKTSDPIG